MADIVGPGVSGMNHLGLWRESINGLGLLVRAGDRAPRLPQETHIWLNVSGGHYLLLGRNGESALVSRTSTNNLSPDSSAGWLTTGNGLTPFAIGGQPAPAALNGALYSQSVVGFPMAFDRQSRLHFDAVLDGPGVQLYQNNRALLLIDTDETRLVARLGDPLPNAPGEVIRSLPTWMVFPDNPDRYLIEVSAGPPNQFGTPAYLCGGIDNLQVLPFPREGLPAPAGPVGATITSFWGRPVTSGRLSLQATVLGGGISVQPHRRIYVGTPDALQMLVEKEDPAPGMPPGSVFADFSLISMPTGPALLRADVARNTTPPSITRGLWWFHQAGLALLAVEGQPAPGIPDAYLGRPIDGVFVPALDVNERGDTVLLTDLHGPSFTSIPGDRAIYVARRGGSLELWLRSGYAVPLPDGQTKTIRTFENLQYSGPDVRSWNDRRQLVVLAEFTDNSKALLVLTDSAMTPACAADANADGTVDFRDLVLVLSAFGASPGPGGPGDLNFDGVVDFLDLNLVLSNFGSAC